MLVLCPVSFGMLHLHLHLCLSIFWFSLWWFKSAFYKFQKLWVFWFSFCYQLLTSSCCVWRRYFIQFLSFLNYWDLICGLKCGLCWKVTPALLRTACPVVGEGDLCPPRLCSIGLSPVFSYFFMCLLSGCSDHYREWLLKSLLLEKRQLLPLVLSILASFVDGTSSLDCVLPDAWMFTIVTSPCCAEPCVNTWRPCPSRAVPSESACLILV